MLMQTKASMHVETVVLLVRKTPDAYGVKVSSLYIAQVKEKFGIKERENYNKPKNVDAKQPLCPKDKEQFSIEALNYFRMIKS